MMIKLNARFALLAGSVNTELLPKQSVMLVNGHSAPLSFAIPVRLAMNAQTRLSHSCTVCEEGYECVGSEKIACAADKWSSRGDGICKFFDASYDGYAVSGNWDGSGVA